LKLENKVIVITGSTRGIGRAIAEECGKEGSKIVISSRNEEAVKETCKLLKEKGYNAEGIVADVSKEDDIKKLFEFTIDKYGAIDVWINNAGLSGGYRFLYDLSETEIKDIVNVNITGILLSCKVIIPYFIEKKKGIILNISGKGGRGEASPYLTTYSATKSAVTNLTKSLAKEYKSNPITICSLIPGMVETDFYKDMKVSPGLEKQIKRLPFILKAFGVPKEKVGKKVVKIVSQKPGKGNGKQYSCVSFLTIIKAIFRMMFYKK